MDETDNFKKVKVKVHKDIKRIGKTVLKRVDGKIYELDVAVFTVSCCDDQRNVLHRYKTTIGIKGRVV